MAVQVCTFASLPLALVRSSMASRFADVGLQPEGDGLSVGGTRRAAIPRTHSHLELGQD